MSAGLVKFLEYVAADLEESLKLLAKKVASADSLEAFEKETEEFFS